MNEPCADSACDEMAVVRGLCEKHYQRDYRCRRQANGGPLLSTTNSPVLTGDDWFVACPKELLPLVGLVADLDAAAIVRAIWPHLLEASLAGLQPFTLDEAS